MSYLVKIGTTDITPYLKGYVVGLEEMWTEADRNLAGNLMADYVGVAPKIELTFRELTQTEMSTVLGLLVQTFSVTWWEEASDTYKTGYFYRGPLQRELRDINSKRYKEFKVNIIAFNTISV